MARGVPRDLRDVAIAACLAPVATIGRGPWRGYHDLAEPEGIGLLVLEGLLIRRIGINGRFGAELLGEGDLLRPWEPPEADWAAAPTVGWRALSTARIAVLDARVAYRLAHYPGLTGQLVGRALRRSRNLAVNMAIVHQARIELRLQMLFWHLAERWGVVGPTGIRIPLRLTHTVLADLAAARRPTISTTLGRLTAQGLISHSKRGWMLHGRPPREMLEVQQMAGGIEGDAPSGGVAPRRLQPSYAQPEQPEAGQAERSLPGPTSSVTPVVRS